MTARDLQRFVIYSKDPEIAFPLVELSIKRADIIAGIKAGTFPLEEVAVTFKRVSDALQEAIKAGKEA